MRQFAVWSLFFMSGALPGLQAAPREWTDVTGRKIMAEFVAVADGQVTLLVNGKEYKLPVTKLSAADQPFLKARPDDPAPVTPAAPEAVPPLPAAEKPPAELIRKVEITQRAFPDADGYYTGRFGKLLYDYYLKSMSAGGSNADPAGLDARTAVVWKKTEGIGTGTMLRHVPSNYDGTEAFGVMVYISAGPSGVNMKPDWDKLFAEKKLIYCSPFGAGNEQAAMRRFTLALDAVATVRKDFKIDPERLFISGTSGGGAIATMVGVNYAEFKAIDCSRGTTPESKDCFSYLGPKEIREVAKQKKRFAWVSGPKDYAYEGIKRGVLAWSAANVKSKLFEHPDQGHAAGTADLLGQAITWIEDAPVKK